MTCVKEIFKNFSGNSMIKVLMGPKPLCPLQDPRMWDDWTLLEIKGLKIKEKINQKKKRGNLNNLKRQTKE